MKTYKLKNLKLKKQYDIYYIKFSRIGGNSRYTRLFPEQEAGTDAGARGNLRNPRTQGNPRRVFKQIEYYDDEELDRFKGVEPDAYEDADVEEFREVLYTLQEVEVAGWLRSLQLREVNLPDALKDEAFLIVGERRIH